MIELQATRPSSGFHRDFGGDFLVHESGADRNVLQLGIGPFRERRRGGNAVIRQQRVAFLDFKFGLVDQVVEDFFNSLS